MNSEIMSLFGGLPERELRRKGLFIAESPQVISRAIEAGLQPEAVLCVEGTAPPPCDAPVYTAPESELRKLTGYALTRGMLAAFQRPENPTPEDVCCGIGRVVVLDNVIDAVNVGSIFRSAAALGMDAVLLTPDCCDPLNRRACRVSMGNVFALPWTWIDNPTQLRLLGFNTAAMALTDDSVAPDNPQLMSEPRLAIILGNEGEGMPRRHIADADYRVCIPMSRDVDSLNVATAAAIAFWQLRR